MGHPNLYKNKNSITINYWYHNQNTNNVTRQLRHLIKFIYVNKTHWDFMHATTFIPLGNNDLSL